MNRLIWLTTLLISISAHVHAKEQHCSPKKHASVPALTDMTYHKARKILLAKGWQPQQTKSYNTAADDPDISSGNGKVFWDSGYIEVEACAGTGVSPCAFLFSDVYGTKLRVTTIGEEDPGSKAYAIISGYRFVCE
ncbi:MAG: hypothetical protein EOO15_20715 [Chitinophagaceae bacterium]|nr:MAG: hypothetical protein EOO15_20715 [Chitinophagaceae bacterium]